MVDVEDELAAGDDRGRGDGQVAGAVAAEQAHAVVRERQVVEQMADGRADGDGEVVRAPAAEVVAHGEDVTRVGVDSGPGRMT